MKETAAYPHSPASSFEQAVSAIKSIEGTDRKQVFNLRSQTPDVRFGRTALNRYIMKNEGILNSYYYHSPPPPPLAFCSPKRKYNFRKEKMKSALLTPSVEEINITNERVYTNSYDVKPLVFYRPVEKQQSSHYSTNISYRSRVKTSLKRVSSFEQISNKPCYISQFISDPPTDSLHPKLQQPILLRAKPYTMQIHSPTATTDKDSQVMAMRNTERTQERASCVSSRYSADRSEKRKYLKGSIIYLIADPGKQIETPINSPISKIIKRYPRISINFCSSKKLIGQNSRKICIEKTEERETKTYKLLQHDPTDTSKSNKLYASQVASTKYIALQSMRDVQCNVIKVERKGILGNKRCFTLKMAPTIRSIESAADRRSILDSRYMQWLHENGYLTHLVRFNNYNDLMIS